MSVKLIPFRVFLTLAVLTLSLGQASAAEEITSTQVEKLRRELLVDLRKTHSLQARKQKLQQSHHQLKLWAERLSQARIKSKKQSPEVENIYWRVIDLKLQVSLVLDQSCDEARKINFSSQLGSGQLSLSTSEAQAPKTLLSLLSKLNKNS